MINVAVLSYCASATVFFMLSALLLSRWRTHAGARALVLPAIVTSVSSAMIAYSLVRGVLTMPHAALLDIGRNACWTIFLLTALSPLLAADRTNRPWRHRAIVGVATLYLAAVFTVSLSAWQPVTGEVLPMVTILLRVALTITGMLLVEQVYRNTPQRARWAIKFACLGIGGMFAYEFYVYSDALLFQQVNPAIWTARGMIDLVIAPMIGVSCMRNATWSSELTVSRRMFFHSVTLVGCAVYLLTMAAAGYYLRYIDGDWGTMMQTVFLFGALVLLLTMLFSGAARSLIKVFISKNFYNYDYDYREEWLRFTRTLSEGGNKLGERTVQAVADLVESPGGTLCIKRSTDWCEPVAHWNLTLAIQAEPAGSPLCQFLSARQWVIDLDELHADPDKYDHLRLPDWLIGNARARFVVPLILNEGLFGFVVLAHPRSALTLNWEIIDLLKISGRQAASYIAQQEAADALMVARQFESFNRMSAFVVHDLKNVVSQLSLLLMNAEKHKQNPAFQADMQDTIDHSIAKMKLLLDKVGRAARPEQPSPLLLEDVLRQAVAAKAQTKPCPHLEIHESGLVVSADYYRLERVIGHLIQNAIDATSAEGRVVVRLSRQNGCALIELEDSGHGMSEEFIRERLFRAFDSTKSAGMGIGVFESRAYIRELQGQITVASRETKGTTFSVLLPLVDDGMRVVRKFA